MSSKINWDIIRLICCAVNEPRIIVKLSTICTTLKRWAKVSYISNELELQDCDKIIGTVHRYLLINGRQFMYELTYIYKDGNRYVLFREERPTLETYGQLLSSVGPMIRRNYSWGVLVERQHLYHHSIKESLKYYESGIVKAKQNYNFINRLHEEYYPNGVLHKKFNYKNGRLSGEYNEFYQNGKPRVRAIYSENKRKYNLYEIYTEKGVLIKRTTYKKGRYITQQFAY